MSFLLSRKNRRCFGGTLVGLLLVLQLSAVVFPAMAAATGPTPSFEKAKQLDNVQEGKKIEKPTALETAETIAYIYGLALNKSEYMHNFTENAANRHTMVSGVIKGSGLVGTTLGIANTFKDQNNDPALGKWAKHAEKSAVLAESFYEHGSKYYSTYKATVQRQNLSVTQRAKAMLSTPIEDIKMKIPEAKRFYSQLSGNPLSKGLQVASENFKNANLFTKITTPLAGVGFVLGGAKTVIADNNWDRTSGVLTMIGSVATVVAVAFPPAALIAGGIAVAATGASVLIDYRKEISQFARNIGNKIANSKFGRSVARGWKRAKNTVKNGWHLAKNIGSSVKKAAGNGIRYAGQRLLRSAVSQVRNTVRDFIHNTKRTVAKGVLSAFNFVSNTKKKVRNAVSHTVKRIGASVRNTAKRIGSKVRHTVSRISNFVRSTAKRVSSSALKKVGKGLKFVRSTAKKLRQTGSNVSKSIRTTAKKVTSSFRKTTSNVFKPVRTTAKKVTPSFRKTTSKVFKPVRTTAKRLTSSFRKATSKVSKPVRTTEKKVTPSFRKATSKVSKPVRTTAKKVTSSVRKAVSKLKKPVRSIAKKTSLRVRKSDPKVLRRGASSFRDTSRRRAS